jgi:hypothetical protein
MARCCDCHTASLQIDVDKNARVQLAMADTAFELVQRDITESGAGQVRIKAQATGSGAGPSVEANQSLYYSIY